MTYEEYFTDIANKYERLKETHQNLIDKLNEVANYIRFVPVKNETKIRIVYGNGNECMVIDEMNYDKKTHKVSRDDNYVMPPHIKLIYQIINIERLFEDFIWGKIHYDNTTDL